MISGIRNENPHLLRRLKNFFVILTIAFAVLTHLSNSCIIYPSLAIETFSITVNENDSIQEAINNAPEGTTIYIEPGTYKEYQIIVNKTLTIIGRDKEKTIIDGGQETEATALFSIIASYVKIKNLTLINTRSDIGRAIILKDVENVTIENCIIFQNYIGIEINNSNNSKITRNLIANNTFGIKLPNGALNVMAFNSLEDNKKGVSLDINGKNNLLYNNNFKNDQNREGFGVTFNNWSCNYVIGGNYWNDYKGNDEKSGPNQDQYGSDGIGDNPYGNYSDEDAYPYMNKLKHFYIGIWGSKEFYVTISTNTSNITNIAFNSEQKEIKFTTEQNTTSYCRIIIPKALLNAADNEWTITTNQENISPLIFSDTNFTCLYFAYKPETNQIVIKGTTAIPELQPTTLLILLFITTFLTIVTRKILDKISPKASRTLFHKP
ncbi:MAG: right-handed parallel beta-helix repeat-containing protein [Candidatus Bathyarchaeia archaeon]|jgi:parallel beta-helix repeat protein